MPRVCSRIRIGDAVGIVCTRSGRAPRCSCGRPSARQCDFPIGKRGRTCSRHLCTLCAVTRGPVKRIEAIRPEDIAADPALALALERGLLPRSEVVDDTLDYCPDHARQLEEREAELAARLSPATPAVPVATRIEPEQLELGGF